MLYAAILNPSSVPGNGGEEIQIFADSTNSNALSTKLRNGTVVPIADLVGGFHAEGTTDGQDFIIESDLVADIGLVIDFDTDGNLNQIGNFYGANSEFNALFGEYFGISVETRPFIIETNGGVTGEVYVLPRAAGTAVQNFVIAGGVVGGTVQDFVTISADSTVNDTASINIATSLGTGISFLSDGANDINVIGFTSTTNNEINSDGNLTINITGAGNDLAVDCIGDINIVSGSGVIDITNTLGVAGFGIAADEAFLYGTNVYLGVITGSTIVQSASFNFPGYQTFANNAAALVGGLVSGDIYAVTGTDPLQLAIVI